MVESAHAFSEACGLETGHAARLAIIIEELVYNLVDHGGIVDQLLDDDRQPGGVPGFEPARLAE
ncbi:MAG: hypothetical protein EOP61_29615, partial [Sphingomonadales bacterium]